MPRIGLILARYSVSRRDVGLSVREQISLFEKLKDAPAIPYRVKEPTPDDYCNYIIQPRSGTRKREPFITWIVCKDIRERHVRKVDRINQVVHQEFERTDDCQVSRIVAIPRLGVLAAEDAAGEAHLGGLSAIKRSGAIIESFDDALEFDATSAGTSQDLERAVGTWEIERFMFQARPFNPHPSNPGLILSKLMEKDGVGELRGVALPKEGQHIRPFDEGIVKETMGLADKGYAVYGAEGRTPSGAEARVIKPKFSTQRSKNLKALSGPQQLRVYIDGDDDEEHIRKMADVLLEFFAESDSSDEH